MTDAVFRGKRADGKGWAEGRVFIAICIGGENIIFIVNHGERACASIDENYNLVDLETFGCKIIPQTFGRYIGKKDKNKNRIFEGDIVKGCWDTVFEVFFDEDRLQYRARTPDGLDREIDYYGDSDKLEVIGKIHDNPELFCNSELLEVEE